MNENPVNGHHGMLAKSSAVAAATAPPPSSLFVKRQRLEAGEAEAIRRPSISYWQDARMRLAKNKVAVASAVYILLLALAAAIVPEVIPYQYDEQEIWNKHRLPNLGEEVLVVDPSAGGYQPVTVEVDDAGGDAPASTDYGVEPPAAPKNLRLMGEPLTTGIAMQWDAVPGVEGYRVYRSIAADTLGVPVEDVPADRASFLDTASLAGGVTYYYHVAAFNPFGDSPEPAVLEAKAKLALALEDAQKLVVGPGSLKVGDTVLTKPHYFGTDYLGRDLLARVMIGARVSLFIGIFGPLLYIFFGIVYGSVSGFFGGLVDDVMMRIADVVSTVPELLVVILLQVMLGAGLTTLVIAMVAVSWARSARQIRGEVLRLREMEFIHAATVLGTGFRKTVFRHLLPNVMGTVLVVMTLAVPQAIFTEAFLSFIGLGIQPPMTSWGIVTKEGARVFMTYPHELLIPSVLICTTMLAFNLLGDGLRDALDPKLRGAK